MPIEPAIYITDFVATDPLHTDGLGNADAHVRLIKAVLQNTFPNLSGAVTAAQGDLNAVTGVLNLTSGALTVPAPSGGSTGASLVLAGNGTNPAVSLVNTGTSAVLKSGTTTILTVDPSGNGTFAGTVNATSIKQGGNVLIPAGMIMLWSGAANAIPAGWLLCNGSSGTPDLRDRFIVGAGSTYGVSGTGGATSVTPTGSSAGSHSHTGLVGAAGGHSHTAVSDLQGAHSHGGSAVAHTLTVDEIPAHIHAEQIGVGSGGSLATWAASNSASDQNGMDIQTQSTGSGLAHAHTINVDGAHSHGVTVAAVADHQHTIGVDGAHTHTVTVATLPPYYALCYVMKS